jgi:SAM-dependent methyltransferase
MAELASKRGPMCPLCGGPPKSVSHVGSFSVGKCCLEFVLGEPVLTPSSSGSLSSLYGEADVVTPRVTCFLEAVHEVIRPPGVLHDHGCGNGQLINLARSKGWEAQGNDLVEGEHHVGPLTELDLPAASCDVVTSYCVLPHLSDPLMELTAIRRLLKDGGWLVAEMPTNGTYRRVARLLRRLNYIYEPSSHRLGFDERSARLAFEKAGFRNVRVRAWVQPASFSLVRFERKPMWFRAMARMAVGLLSKLGPTNHIVVYGQVL